MNTNKEVNNDPTVITVEIDNYEDELKRLNVNNSNIDQAEKERNNQNFIAISSMNKDKIIMNILIIILIISIIVFITSIKYLIIPNLLESNDDDYAILPKVNQKENNELLKNITLYNQKISIAFVYSTLYANGIARFITVAANYLVNTGKYNIYIITEKPSTNEYACDKRITRIIEGNSTLLRNKTKDLNIDFFILQNTSVKSKILFFKSIGKFVIGMFHGLYTSSMFHGKVSPYKNWINFDDLDAFVFIGYDDYFFYKKLGFKNEIFIPNFYTFEPNKTIDSELNTHNIVMLGRAGDEIKGIIYAIKTMSLIVKEVPDAKLILLSSSYKIDHLKNYSYQIGVYENINFKYYTQNITEVFMKSSVLMYTSLSEAFPLAMVEGKAHGLPVAAFDVACSPPYQEGVIGVDMLDCEALANETIKLLKNRDYRIKMGREAKLSLNQFNNEETEKLWYKLFISLLKGKKYFNELQKEVEDRYYNEDKARERMEKRYRDLLRLNKNFTCHTLNDFTNLNYIKNIKECPYNNTNDNNNQK
jgi:glycosyltransferase involved in cell wall biosynthesis